MITQDDSGNDRYRRPDDPVARSCRIQPRQEHHGESEVAAGYQRTGESRRLAKRQECDGTLGLDAFPAYLDPLVCQYASAPTKAATSNSPAGAVQGTSGGMTSNALAVTTNSQPAKPPNRAATTRARNGVRSTEPPEGCPEER